MRFQLIFIFGLVSSVASTTFAANYPRIFQGTITNSMGEPISGARVEYGYFSAEENDRQTVLSQEDGSYTLEIREAGRDYRLSVSADGYAPKYLDRVLPGPQGLPAKHGFQLQSVPNVKFRFVFEDDKPAADVTVRAKTPQIGSVYSSFSSPVPPTPLPGHDSDFRTDEQGLVSIPNLPPLPAAKEQPNVADKRAVPVDWITLEITANERTTQQQINSEVIATSMTDGEIKIAISSSYNKKRPNGYLRGRIVDETGKPIKKYTLVHRYSAKAIDMDTKEGRFTSGTRYRHGKAYEVRIFKPGYAVCVGKPVAGEEDKAKEFVFRLKRYPSLRGRVVDSDGKPLAGIEVLSGFIGENSYAYIEWSTLSSYADGHHSLNNVLRVKTNENGEFTVPEAPNQAASLIIVAPNHARTIVPPSKRPKVAADGFVTIKMRRAAAIVAIADRDSELGELANAVGLSFQSDDQFDHMYHSERLNQDGTKQYESLAPGTYNVALYLESSSASYPIYSMKVTLAEGEEVAVELGKIDGSLTLSGTAQPFSMVRINPKDNKQWPRYFAVKADIDGHFRLSNLPPGTYTVRPDSSSSSRGFHGQGRTKTVELNEHTTIELP